MVESLRADIFSGEMNAAIKIRRLKSHLTDLSIGLRQLDRSFLNLQADFSCLQADLKNLQNKMVSAALVRTSSRQSEFETQFNEIKKKVLCRWFSTWKYSLVNENDGKQAIPLDPTSGFKQPTPALSYLYSILMISSVITPCIYSLFHDIDALISSTALTFSLMADFVFGVDFALRGCLSCAKSAPRSSQRSDTAHTYRGENVITLIASLPFGLIDWASAPSPDSTDDGPPSWALALRALRLLRLARARALLLPALSGRQARWLRTAVLATVSIHLNLDFGGGDASTSGSARWPGPDPRRWMDVAVGLFVIVRCWRP